MNNIYIKSRQQCIYMNIYLSKNGEDQDLCGLSNCEREKTGKAIGILMTLRIKIP